MAEHPETPAIEQAAQPRSAAQASQAHHPEQAAPPVQARPASGAPHRGPRASLKQLIPYLFEQRGPLVLAIALGLVAAVASLLQPVLLGQVIERVQQGDPLAGLLVVLSLIVVVGAVLSGLQHYVLQRMGEGVVLHSRKHLIAKILRLPISQFDRRRTGDLVSRIGSDTTLLRAVLTQGLVEAVSGMLVFVGALVGMLVIDPVLFAIAFGVVLAALIIVVAVSRRIRPAVTRAQEKVGDLAAQVDRTISSIRTIRAAGAAEREEAATVRDATEAYELGLKVAKISAFIVPISFLAMQLTFLVVLGLGGFRVATGAITIAQLVTFIIFLFLMIMPLGQAFGAITAVNQALGALGRIQEIASLPTETEHDAELSPAGRIMPLDEAVAAIPVDSAHADRAADGAGAAGATAVHSSHGSASDSPRLSCTPVNEVHTGGTTAPAAPTTAPSAPAIAFHDVCFTYRSAAPDRADARELVRRGSRRDLEAAPAPIIETPVLHGVSFDVPRGSRVALVGPSGAGKSTILGLVERFYDPDSGSVSLYGADLRLLDRAEVRAQMGYVEQDAPVLAGSLRDNLRLASPEASDAACERVLRAVNLGGLLDRDPSAPLARALDLQVGENGLLLSGGEKQRLAIARALLTAPPILLLDESTASLDGVNERLMREALDSVSTGRTLIVIAHRLSTVVDSDKIVVLDGGRVVGEGTHAELIESTPLYRELAKHQLLVPEEA